jgi:tetratricopeptide (TPR) repeat protein
MKKFLFILFINFGFSPSLCFSQNKANPELTKTIDSLLTLIKTDKADTTKLIHLNKLSREYDNKGLYDSALLYSNISIQLEKGSVKESSVAQRGKANSFINKGIAYYYKGNNPEALTNYFTSLKIRDTVFDKAGIANCYNNIGVVYKDEGSYTLALKNHFLALKIRESIADKKGIATSYNNIGNVYLHQAERELSAFDRNDRLETALKNQSASLKIMQEIGDKKGIANCYSNIANVYSAQADREKNDSIKNDKYEEALKNHFASLKLEEEIGDNPGISTSYKNIGNVLTKQNKKKEAKEYFDKVKKMPRDKKNKISLRNAFLIMY